jgi:hypothetical protein
MIRILACSAVLLCLTHSAMAQDIKRCQRSDGSVVFTDGFCEADQTEKATAPASTTPGRPAPYRQGIPPPPACNASPDELLYSVKSAIDMQDINQLAKHYHWPGVSSGQSKSILDRLELLVNRPLLDIRLSYRDGPATPEPPSSSWQDALYGAPSPEPGLRPYGLKVVQNRSRNDQSVLATQFQLQHYFHCWWIRY